ncbi:LysR family transcriptional regulator [Ruegeria sp.]|uniref:LysR family transcriptional regulator n=1 Tax=Ruegeria sp. TaxID=1879320 RepID=UPI003B5BC8EB
MHNLPPLTALRAFEAASRCGSFVLAGQELGVSSAAVSLQIKGLEDHLGKKLFLRKGNRISLTDAGEMMYPKLAEAFHALSDAVQIARDERPGRRLVVSVLPALSQRWFLDKAIAFRAQTNIPLDVRVQEDPIEFERDAIDVRLTYESTMYSGHVEMPLFSDVAVPVCSPEFWARYADPEGQLCHVPDATLIHNNWGPSYASEPLWRDWRKAAGWKEKQWTDPGFRTNDLSMAIALAHRGAGMALVPSALVTASITSGALLCPSQTRLPMKKDYVSVVPVARLENQTVRLFLDAIR